MSFQPEFGSWYRVPLSLSPAALAWSAAKAPERLLKMGGHFKAGVHFKSISPSLAFGLDFPMCANKCYVLEAFIYVSIEMSSDF